jgi:hypothetical protein
MVSMIDSTPRWAQRPVQKKQWQYLFRLQHVQIVIRADEVLVLQCSHVYPALHDEQ